MHWSHVLLLGVLCGLPGCAGTGAAGTPPGAVQPGIDVLLADSAHLVRGRRVGLVTNQSGVDASGVSDVVRLRAAGVRLVALFSPEHGFRGAAEPGAAVASSVDSATGLPIYSLYGRTSAPTDEMLAGIDVLLVDLQDAGARYYTYITTTVDVMNAAAGKGIPVVVLDRPNPIGGAVQGNVLEEAHISAVGRLRVPMRHGLTLGEMARLAQADLGIGGELVVVPVSGWSRRTTFDQTGLPFIPPSPNLRTLESLFHYPGTCLFEGTNLSVGRGSEAPFEQVGAPWLDAPRVAATMNAMRLPGIRFEAITMPVAATAGKYPGQTIPAIRFVVTDRQAYRPVRTSLLLIDEIRRQHPRDFAWTRTIDRLTGSDRVRLAIEGGRLPALLEEWDREAAEWLETRKPFLLYPDR